MVESAAKPTSLTRKLSNWKIAKTGFNAQYFCANSDQVETPQRLSFSVSWAQLHCFPGKNTPVVADFHVMCPVFLQKTFFARVPEK